MIEKKKIKKEKNERRKGSVLKKKMIEEVAIENDGEKVLQREEATVLNRETEF